MNTIASSYIQQRQSTNLLALLLWTTFILLCATYLANVNNCLLVALVLIIFLFFIFLYWPMTGVYVLIFIFPIQSITIHLSIGLNPPFTSFFYQYLALIMLPVLITRLINNSSLRKGLRCDVIHENHWLLFISALFVAWTPFTLIWSDNPYLYNMVAGLWKHNCNFIFCAYVLLHVNTFNKLKRVLFLWTGVGIMLSIAAIYSNWVGLYERFNLIHTTGFVANLEATFINHRGAFDSAYVRMAPAFGLSVKHELGMFLCTSIVSALFLFMIYKSWVLRFAFTAQLLLYTTVLWLSVAKASMLSLVLGTLLICFFVPQWRKFTPALMSGILAISMLAATLSSFITPIKHVSPTHLVSQLPKDSAFEQGTYAHRLALMGHGIAQVRSSYALGGGPDIMHIIPPEYVHSHNLLISYANDYGIIGIIFILSVLTIFGGMARKILFQRSRPQEPSWLLVCTVAACFLITFFESLTDVYIWYPQIWILGALLLASLRIDNFLQCSCSASQTQMELR